MKELIYELDPDIRKCDGCGRTILYIKRDDGTFIDVDNLNPGDELFIKDLSWIVTELRKMYYLGYDEGHLNGRAGY